MPGQHERHARSKWEWGSPGARSAEVQAAAADDPEPARRGKGRKDTRRWCRGKEGTEHVLVWIPGGWRGREHPCEWTYQYARREHGFTIRWWCRHEVRCSVCKKVLRSRIPEEDCPDYPGLAGQKERAQAEGAEVQARFEERQSGRRVITGPQGFRRKRGS
jgi:hypothetical protein